MKESAEETAEIVDTTLDGRGVTRGAGKTAFVRGALQGETVRFRRRRRRRNYDEAELLEILEPSRVISEQHASTTLVLKNNKVLDGRVVGSDDDTIRIVTDAKNPDNVTEVKKSDVLAQEKSKNSLMPNDILNVLTEEEILDLLMYLASGGKAGHIAFDK